MSVPVRRHRHSFQDYLAVEEVSTVKHEFLDGEIYAMAGGTILHAALSASTMAALHRNLGARCRLYSSDLRIRVRATGLASYPDVTMVCGPEETDPENAETIVNPTLVVEVLSPGTMDYDLGEKFEHYRQIPSLAAVVYVSQDRRQIEVRENAAGTWKMSIAGPGETATISSLGLRLDVDAVYDDAGAPASSRPPATHV